MLIKGELPPVESCKEHQKLVKQAFNNLMEKDKLAPYMNHLDSVYLRCPYSHGHHTSRSFTQFSPKHIGFVDHLIYTPNMLKVNKILEIPTENELSPSHYGQEFNHVTALPNIIFPSDHLRIEAEFEL